MSFWTDRKAVVTGASGFIGSHLVERLAARGAKVTASGRSRERFLARYDGTLPEGVEFSEGDLRDPDYVSALCKGQDAVLNLVAEVAGVGYNSTHPGTIFTDNLQIAGPVIDAAARQDVERFLCVSSACIYQRACTVPTPECEGFEGDPEPTNFGYGWAKRALEVQARGYAEQFDMKIGIARPYNGYGPRDDFEWETSHVIPALIRKVVEGQNPIEVWGDGSQTRSFLYVDDFADGLILSIEKHPDPDPINIGTDEETTIADLIRLIIRLCNSDSEIFFDTSKPKGQPRRNGDFTLARERLGFEAQVGLEEGLRRTIDWYLAQR